MPRYFPKPPPRPKPKPKTPLKPPPDAFPTTYPAPVAPTPVPGTYAFLPPEMRPTTTPPATPAPAPDVLANRPPGPGMAPGPPSWGGPTIKAVKAIQPESSNWIQDLVQRQTSRGLPGPPVPRSTQAPSGGMSTPDIRGAQPEMPISPVAPLDWEANWKAFRDAEGITPMYVWVPNPRRGKGTAGGRWIDPLSVDPLSQLVININQGYINLKSTLQQQYGFQDVWGLHDVLVDPMAPPLWGVPQDVWDQTSWLRSGLGMITEIQGEFAEKVKGGFFTMMSIFNWSQKSAETAVGTPLMMGYGDIVGFWTDYAERNRRLTPVSHQGQMGYWMYNDASSQWDFVPVVQVAEWRTAEYQAYEAGLADISPDAYYRTHAGKGGGKSVNVLDEEYKHLKVMQFEAMTLNPDGSTNWNSIFGDILGRSAPKAPGLPKVWANSLADAIWNSQGLGGLAASYILDDGNWRHFVELVESGASIQDAMMKTEKFWAEVVTAVVLDPFGIFGISRLGKVGELVDRAMSGFATFGLTEVAGPAISALTRPLLKLDAGSTAIYLRAAFQEKDSLGRSVYGLSKQSHVNEWMQHLEDAFGMTARLKVNFPDVDIETFWQRVLLEAADPTEERRILLSSNLPESKLLLIRDGVAALEETVETLEIRDVLKKYGAFADVDEAMRPDLINAMIKGVDEAEQVGYWLVQAMTDQYSKQMGLQYIRAGSFRKWMDTTSRLAKEWWLGLSIVYPINNGLDNTIKTIMSNYSPTFDLNNFSKVNTYLMDTWGWRTPENTVQSLVKETIGDIDRVGATEMLPWPLGRIEGTIGTVQWLSGHPTALTKTASDWVARHQSVRSALNSFNVSNFMNKSFRFSAMVEKSARANIFIQEFEADILKNGRPGMVGWIKSLPPDLNLDGLALAFERGDIKSLDDITAWQNLHVGGKPGQWVPEDFWGDLRPEGSPSNQLMTNLRNELNQFHQSTLATGAAPTSGRLTGRAAVVDWVNKKFDEYVNAITVLRTGAVDDIIRQSEIAEDSIAREIAELGADTTTLPPNVAAAVEMQDLQRQSTEIMDEIQAERSAKLWEEQLDTARTGYTPASTNPETGAINLEELSMGELIAKLEAASVPGGDNLTGAMAPAKWQGHIWGKYPAAMSGLADVLIFGKGNIDRVSWYVNPADDPGGIRRFLNELLGEENDGWGNDEWTGRLWNDMTDNEIVKAFDDFLDRERHYWNTNEYGYNDWIDRFRQSVEGPIGISLNEREQLLRESLAEFEEPLGAVPTPSGPALLPEGAPTAATWMAQHPVSSAREALQRYEHMVGAKALGLGPEGAADVEFLRHSMDEIESKFLGAATESEVAIAWKDFQDMMRLYPGLQAIYESAVVPDVTKQFGRLIATEKPSNAEMLSVAQAMEVMQEHLSTTRELTAFMNARGAPGVAQAHQKFTVYPQPGVPGVTPLDFFGHLAPSQMDLETMELTFDKRLGDLQDELRYTKEQLDRTVEDQLFTRTAIQQEYDALAGDVGFAEQLKNIPPGANRIAAAYNYLSSLPDWARSTAVGNWNDVINFSRGFYGEMVVNTWVKDFYTDVLLTDSLQTLTYRNADFAVNNRGRPFFEAWPTGADAPFWAPARTFTEQLDINRTTQAIANANAMKGEATFLFIDPLSNRVGTGGSWLEAFKRAFDVADDNDTALSQFLGRTTRANRLGGDFFYAEVQSPETLAQVTQLDVARLGEKPFLVGGTELSIEARTLIDNGFEAGTPTFNKELIPQLQADPMSARFPTLRALALQDLPTNWAPGFAYFYPKGGIETVLNLEPHFDELFNGAEKNFYYDIDEHVFMVDKKGFDPIADQFREANPYTVNDAVFLEFNDARTLATTPMTSADALRNTALMLDEIGLSSTKIVDGDGVTYTIQELIDTAPPIQLSIFDVGDVEGTFSELLAKYSPAKPVHEMGLDEIEQWYKEWMQQPNRSNEWAIDVPYGDTDADIADFMKTHPSLEWHQENLISINYHGTGLNNQHILKGTWTENDGLIWSADVHASHDLHNTKAFMTALGPNHWEVEVTRDLNTNLGELMGALPVLRAEGVPLDCNIRLWMPGSEYDETRTLGEWLAEKGTTGVRPLQARKAFKADLIAPRASPGAPLEEMAVTGERDTLPRLMKNTSAPERIYGVWDDNERWYFTRGDKHDIDADGAGWFYGNKESIIVELRPDTAQNLYKQANFFNSLYKYGILDNSTVTLRSFGKDTADVFAESHTLAEWKKGISDARKSMSRTRPRELLPTTKGLMRNHLGNMLRGSIPPTTISGQAGELGGVYDFASKRFAWDVQVAPFNHASIREFLFPGEQRGTAGRLTRNSSGMTIAVENLDHAVEFIDLIRREGRWMVDEVPIRVYMDVTIPDGYWPWDRTQPWDGTVGSFLKDAKNLSTSAAPAPRPAAAQFTPEDVKAFNEEQIMRNMQDPINGAVALDVKTGRFAFSTEHAGADSLLGLADGPRRYFQYNREERVLYSLGYYDNANFVNNTKLGPLGAADVAPFRSYIDDDTRIVIIGEDTVDDVGEIVTEGGRKDIGSLWEVSGAKEASDIQHETVRAAQPLGEVGAEAEVEPFKRIEIDYASGTIKVTGDPNGWMGWRGLERDLPPETLVVSATTGEPLGLLGDYMAKAPAIPPAPGNVARSLQEQSQLDWRASEVGKVNDEFSKTADAMEKWRQAVLADAGGGGGGGSTGGWMRSQREFDNIGPAMNDIKRRWLNTLDAASYRAVGKVNEKLFDYTAKGDTEQFLRGFAPFTTWQLRNPVFWAQAFSRRPGVLAQAVRFMQAAERERTRYGLTERFKNTFGGYLENDAGPIPAGYYGFNMTPFISLFSQFRPPFEAPDAYPEGGSKFVQFMRKALQYSRMMGLTPWPWINYPLEAMGIAAKGSTQWSAGPIQRLAELGLQQSGVLPPGQGLFGPNATSQFLNEANMKRGYAEMEREGLITHEDALRARAGQLPDITAQAQERVLRQTGMSQAWSLVSPFQMKYATPGEVGIRGDKAAREDMLLGAEEQYPLHGAEYKRLTDSIYARFPELETYGLAWTDEPRRVEIALLYNKYDQLMEGLQPWTPEYKQAVIQRVAEMEQMFGIMDDPAVLIQEYMNRGLEGQVWDAKAEAWRTMSAGEQHDEVLGRLEDVQPRASQFQDESGIINWEKYDAAWTSFLDQIPGLSRQFGYEVDYADFIKWHYRSAAPQKIAYDLYQDFKSANWDKYYELKPELEPGGKYWDEMVSTTATTERLKDLDRGFTPYEADQRYAVNLQKYVSTGEIPYVYYEEWRNKLLDPLIISDTVNLNTFTFQVAEMMGIDLQDNPLLYDEMSRRLNYELPGMVVADVYDNARDVLNTYFYDQLTPQEQQEITSQFGSWGIPKDDTKMYKMYQQVLYYTTPRARFEGPAGDIPPGFNIPPLDSSLTDEEREEIGQALVEHYRYQKAREAGVAGTWTPLVDKYYGNPNSNQSKFWDVLEYASLSSNAFTDPVVSQIMSRSARTTFQYTEEQWGAALQYLKDNWDTLIDPEMTQQIRDHPDWWMQSQQQRAEYDRFKDIDMEVVKSQYYGIAWANREDWQEANPEEWKTLEDYIAREKARAYKYPYYMYWFKQSDYKKSFGSSTPDMVTGGSELSGDFSQAIADMDAFLNGSGNWTDLMQTFYGPPPEGYTPSTQP